MWQDVEGRLKAVSAERESLGAELEKLRAERANRIARVQQLEKQLARSREEGESKEESIQKLQIELRETLSRVQIEINEVCSPLNLRSGLCCSLCCLVSLRIFKVLTNEEHYSVVNHQID